MARLYRNLFGGLLEDDEPTPSLIHKDDNTNFRLYLGSVNDAKNREKLTQLNIKYVINMMTSESPYSEEEKINFKGFNSHDLDNYPISDHFTEITQFINTAKKANDSVLVHCAAGVSRSASVVCAYLISEYGMEFEEAIQHLKARRNCICPNIGFLNQLEALAEAKKNQSG